jgi:hypothetical protein
MTRQGNRGYQTRNRNLGFFAVKFTARNNINMVKNSTIAKGTNEVITKATIALPNTNAPQITCDRRRFDDVKEKLYAVARVKLNNNTDVTMYILPPESFWKITNKPVKKIQRLTSNEQK